MHNAQCTIDPTLVNSIRKQFYALRNGVISDTLRKGGLEQKYIFGLQLPQIKEVANQYRPESDEECAVLARELWADRECRESRLLACHIMPATEMQEQEAMEWTSDIISREEADILAFRLVRYLPFAKTLSEKQSSSDNTLQKYMAIAIQRFL